MNTNNPSERVALSLRRLIYKRRTVARRRLKWQIAERALAALEARHARLCEEIEGAKVITLEPKPYMTAHEREMTRKGLPFGQRGRYFRNRTAAVLLLICAQVCAAVASAQVKGAAALIPALAVVDVKTNKTQMLTWASSESRFAIRSGTNRASVGNRFVVTSNTIPFKSGVVYSVAAINTVGVESAPAYFPSNRVGALIEQTSVNLATWTDGRTLETFTNTPARPQMYLRIVDRTVGWLPPN